MNTRRQFISGLFSILPAATCYKRVWREVSKIPQEFTNLRWLKVDYEIVFIPFDIKSLFVIDSPVGPDPKQIIYKKIYVTEHSRQTR